jgi:hypothetical protein
VLSVRTSKQQLDILDLSTQKRRGIRHLHGKPDGQRTLEDVLTSVAFSADGQELITAAVQQVQVRTLPEGKTRLRLDGATVAYPMADHRLVTLAALDARAVGSDPTVSRSGSWPLANWCELFRLISPPWNGGTFRSP